MGVTGPKRGQERAGAFETNSLLRIFSSVSTRFLFLSRIIIFSPKLQYNILNCSFKSFLGIESVLFCPVELQREGCGSRVVVQL